MGAEDFGLFGQGGVPTFMFRLGTIPPKRMRRRRPGEEPLPSLHSPLFYPDPEPTLDDGDPRDDRGGRQTLASRPVKSDNGHDESLNEI